MDQPVDTVQNANFGLRPGPTLVVGFGSAVVVWTAWFITHLPWFGLQEQFRVGIILVAWMLAAGLLGRGVSFLASVCGGVTCSLLGLLILGSKLAEAPGGAAGSSVKPEAALIAGGFILTGGVIGLLGGFIARVLPARATSHPDWLARFALVTAITCAPLIFIGGLVTSTNSGMAVPDWPRTYGANMFLYPLGSAGANVFLEHTHRLFGTLVGLATLVLLIWTVSRESRTWVKTLAGIVFSLVVFQGILGGIRVRAGHVDPAQDAKFFRLLHGVLAQLTFGTLVALAACLSPSFKKGGPDSDPLPMQARLRIFATGLMHATILQLILGAAYRHFRDKHSLFSHMGFSIVVVILGLAAGFVALSVRGEHSGLGPVIRRTGRWIVLAIGFQFLLGWATFSMGGKGLAAESPMQAVLRTVHQANGAFVLALAVLGFVWAKRLIRLRRPAV